MPLKNSTTNSAARSTDLRRGRNLHPRSKSSSSLSVLLLALCLPTGSQSFSPALFQTTLQRSSLQPLAASIAVERRHDAEFIPEDDDDDLESELSLDSNGATQLAMSSSTVSSPSNGYFKRPPRPSNPAMADAAFLRKRTANLLEVDLSSSISSKGMKVDRKTIHFLMDAWAFSGELDAADQAIKLIERMEELGKENPMLQPDVRSYTKVINAISRSNCPNAGDRAEEILEHMEYLSSSVKNPNAKPNTFTYTAVIEAHANSAAPGSEQRAGELCDIMVTKYLEGDESVRPTTRAFNAAIHAYGKAGMAMRAEALFDRMEKLSSTIPDVRPNAFNYNALISAWANCAEQAEGSAQRAEEILERMEYLFRSGNNEVKPTTVSFNAVIDAYAKSGEEGAAQRAEEILRHMSDLYESGENKDARPNTRSFNSAINAWAKSRQEDAALKAENMLAYMEKLYKAGNHEVRPDVHSYCTVINAWARSLHAGKAQRALNLFLEMKKRYEAGNSRVRPNVVAVNAVMNACAFTAGDLSEQNRAMEIAHVALKELEQSPFGKPDQVTYGTFLKVCANQLPESEARGRIVEAVFRKCCKDGQVGNLVLQQLKMVASRELYESLIGRRIDEGIRMEDLPQEWWCNVVEGKWRRRRNMNS